MTDIVYSVAVQYMQQGSLSLPNGLKDAAGHIDNAQRAFGRAHGAASTFNGVRDGILGTMSHIAVAGAKAIEHVASEYFSKALRESVKFNQEMEDTQTGLATIANASDGLNGFLDPKEAFGNQYRLAGDVIKQMRYDAQTLPGEFKDLQNIMALMAPAASNAGIGMFDTEKLAARGMAAAAALRVPFAVAGREMGNIIAGTATGRMPMFSKMGLGDAKDWNKLSQDDRVSKFRAKLGQMEPGLASVQKNWSTISSNFVDNLKIAAGVVGGPLLDRVKDVLKKFNDSDKGNFHKLGERVGRGLVNAFDYGAAAIAKWFPLVETFAGNLARGLQSAFSGVTAIFDILLPRLESFLKDPAAFHKIEHLVSQLIALRVGGAVVAAGAGLAPGALGMISGLAGGGTAGAATAGAAAIPLAEALALAAAAVYGFTSALTNSESKLHEAAVGTSKSLVSATGRLTGELTKSSGIFQQSVEFGGVAAARWLDWTVAGLAEVAGVVNQFSGALGTAIGYLRGFGGKLNDDTPDEIRERGAASAAAMNALFLDNYNPRKAFDSTAQEGPKAAKPPNNVTNIHKIEIKVDGDADPQRVAKLTVDMLMDKVRSPTSSTGGPPRFDR